MNKTIFGHHLDPSRRMGSSASKAFNPEQDIPDLIGKVTNLTLSTKVPTSSNPYADLDDTSWTL
ncbi:hypothetical protein SCLCIDRAFT_622966 [Scleroderma citrinum Foug A]|uniref:Uncharacterized protein n=1 Tax=Scleroderma citrinum Foug A TaxID=1036808 RepID=A0A0C3D6E7_9AGAM|nr:hypothetical protein SCLCIDRAFT_622966 [Scleroderma citrinum Foug A]